LTDRAKPHEKSQSKRKDRAGGEVYDERKGLKNSAEGIALHFFKAHDGEKMGLIKDWWGRERSLEEARDMKTEMGVSGTKARGRRRDALKDSNNIEDLVLEKGGNARRKQNQVGRGGLRKAGEKSLVEYHPHSENLSGSLKPDGRAAKKQENKKREDKKRKHR